MTNFQRLKNYFLIFIVFLTVFGSSYVFISTVYELQFTNSDYFKNQALSYRVKTEKIKASRGNIYDKNLLILSSSSRSYNIGIFPTKIDRKNAPNDKRNANIRNINMGIYSFIILI